jgi:hypothetical protein
MSYDGLTTAPPEVVVYTDWRVWGH